MQPTAAAVPCNLEHGRGGISTSPRLVLHFGDAADVPARLQTEAPLNKQEPLLCVPIWAYNLGAGADAFEMALHTPRAPLGFEPGPGVALVEKSVTLDADGAMTNLRLAAAASLCGPAYLGCLNLPTADLPQQFAIEVNPHQATGRRGARLDGAWRAASVDEGGAWIGMPPGCPGDGTETEVHDLRARASSELRGSLHLTWSSGSGSFTVLRCRLDGRYPAHPSDGELLAILPSSIESYTHLFDTPGEARITAWSVTTGSRGEIVSASGVECGSLASAWIHLPVGIATRGWGKMKALYR